MQGIMRIITIANIKGDYSLSTTAINLSACLAANLRTKLLIGVDPKGF